MNALALLQVLPDASEDTNNSDVRVSLPGYSGANVTLVKQGTNRTFVRKSAVHASQNARLMNQVVKQRLIGALLNGNIRTPAILDEGEVEGCYYFDMEYIAGIDGITFLRTAPFSAIKRFVEIVRSYFRAFAQDGSNENSAISLRAAATLKCISISAQLNGVDPAASESIARLLERIASWDSAPYLSPTPNHGDMTLENMIITSTGDVVLIDLLDNYIDHWVSDISKIDQDLLAGWYMRKHPPLAMGVVNFVRSALEETIAQIDEGLLTSTIPMLTCINLARILPYAKSAEDRRFVLERMNWLEQRLGPAVR